MEEYDDIDDNSEMAFFGISEDRVLFLSKTGSMSCFSYMSCGKEHVENLKELCRKGTGVDEYIKKHVSLYFERGYGSIDGYKPPPRTKKRVNNNDSNS